MAAKERIFFAGVGTTFAILAIGFGGGLLMANSAVHETQAQKRPAEPPPAVRVVHPTSAQPALQVTAAALQPDPAPSPVPAVATSASESTPMQAERSKQVDRDQQADQAKIQQAERRHAEAMRRKRTAQAKARREARARQQQEQQQPRIMAFDAGDSSRIGFFGN